MSLQTGTVGDVKAAALEVSGPNTCVAVFVGGGSSIETAENAGASKVLEYMAFQATKARCGKDHSMLGRPSSRSVHGWQRRVFGLGGSLR
jgi:hypothetical protein